MSSFGGIGTISETQNEVGFDGVSPGTFSYACLFCSVVFVAGGHTAAKGDLLVQKMYVASTQWCLFCVGYAKITL
jgi:hypothetical protein